MANAHESMVITGLKAAFGEEFEMQMRTYFKGI